MIVQRAEGVRDVETVVNRVDVTVEEFVEVEQAVDDVLPGVKNESFSVRKAGKAKKRDWKAEVRVEGREKRERAISFSLI